MTKVSVEYVDHMGDDLRVANVARVSFNKWKTEMDSTDVKLLSYLASHEHTSPFRHTAIQLRCNVPVFLARQLAKHQAGFSWNEISRRYVDSGFEYYYPEEWHARPEASIKQGCGDTLSRDDQEFCNEALVNVVITCEAMYKQLIRTGVAPEEARMVLPQNMMVQYIWTGNLFSWFHLYRLRSDPTAQTVAREFAGQVDEVCNRLFPHSWAALKENIT